MEEWASSVVKARMLKQGMSPLLSPMGWLWAAGQEVGNSITSGDPLLNTRYLRVVTRTLSVARCPLPKYLVRPIVCSILP